MVGTLTLPLQRDVLQGGGRGGAHEGPSALSCTILRRGSRPQFTMDPDRASLGDALALCSLWDGACSCFVFFILFCYFFHCCCSLSVIFSVSLGMLMNLARFCEMLLWIHDEFPVMLRFDLFCGVALVYPSLHVRAYEKVTCLL